MLIEWLGTYVLSPQPFLAIPAQIALNLQDHMDLETCMQVLISLVNCEYRKPFDLFKFSLCLSYVD